MKRAYILVGLPASGKSTYRNDAFDYNVVLSTDDVIEDVADFFGYTYSEIFKEIIPFAEKVLFDDFEQALSDGENIVVDRTNLNVKTRKKFLTKLLDNDYHVTALVFPTPEPTEWERRLESREGKFIPKNVLESMMERFEMPTLDEGFHDVIVVEEEEYDNPV